MSELINNREHRQEVLKGMINDLHAGKDPKEVKERFKELLAQVGPTEISEIEQQLIDEGMPAEEIQALCDVHVSIFRDTLDSQEQQTVEAVKDDAHPVNVFKAENRAVEQVITDIKAVLDNISDQKTGEDISRQLAKWQAEHSKLAAVEKHYSRKENLLFPYLEKNGITGPPSVMWGIHDEIRDGLKYISHILSETDALADKQLSRQIGDIVLPCLNAISEMIYKEENILFPMCLETLTEDEWNEIAKQSRDIGFTLIEPAKVSELDTTASDDEPEGTGIPDGFLKFETGILTLKEISHIFNHLPLDITFVDKDDRVRYFSQGAERIFERTKAIIGRKVQHCHPPSSVHIVEQIVDDFRSGKRDHADFWINLNNQFIFIRYFAVRDENSEYLGTLEVTQNVTDIRALEGEKRIYDEDKHQ